MAKRGQLEKIGLPRILEWVQSKSITGTLSINSNGSSRFLFFKDGRIIHAYSKDPSEQLGPYLVRKGKLTVKEFKKIIKEANSKGKNLAKILVDKDKLTMDEMAALMKYHARDIILNILDLTEGEFVFYLNQLPSKGFVPLSFSIDKVLQICNKRKQRWERVRQQVPSLELTPRINLTPKIRAQILELPTEQQFVLSKVNGKKNIKEVNRASLNDLLRTCEILSETHNKGIISFTGKDDLVQQAKEAFKLGKYYQAVEKIKEALEQNPDHEEAKQLEKEYTNSLLADIKNKLKSMKSVPEVTTKVKSGEFQKESLDTNAGFILSRIDGFINLSQLVATSGLKKGQITMIIYRLLELGLITLRHPKTIPAQDTDSISFRTSVEISEEDQERIERVLKKARALKSDNLYQMLETNHNASPGELKRQFNKLAREFHPDAFSDQLFKELLPKVNEIFSRIQEAYSTLSNPKKRDDYDVQMGFKGETAESKTQKRLLSKAKLQYSIGNRCFQKRDYNRAIEFFQSAIDLYPYESLYYARLAEAQMKNPRLYEKAKQNCQKAIDLEPQNPHYYIILGDINRKQGNFKEAEKQYYRTLMLDPSNETAIKNLEELTGGPVKPPKEAITDGKDLIIRPNKKNK